jgi:hypothetical protein
VELLLQWIPWRECGWSGSGRWRANRARRLWDPTRREAALTFGSPWWIGLCNVKRARENFRFCDCPLGTQSCTNPMNCLGALEVTTCVPQKSPGLRLSVTNERRIETGPMASSDVGF